MLPKKVKKRASLLAITLIVTVIGIFFILQSLNKNILYFKSPTDIKNNQNINFDRKISAQYNIKTKNINNNGISIEEWIELSPVNLILAG